MSIDKVMEQEFLRIDRRRIRQAVRDGSAMLRAHEGLQGLSDAEAGWKLAS